MLLRFCICFVIVLLYAFSLVTLFLLFHNLFDVIVLLVTRVNHFDKENIYILESKLELKDLGVIVDNHLTFRNHIAGKVNKANQIIVFLDEHNFNLLYKSLVRPHIEYGNIVWSPFWKADMNLIENVQKRATLFIPEINKLDYQERLEKLDLPTLAYIWFHGSVIETYKILHNLCDAKCTNSLFEFKESNTQGQKFAVLF